MPQFQVVSDFVPMGDQPQAIRKLEEGIEAGYKHQTLLGATGTGKSLGYDDPVFIIEKRGDTCITRVTPIGPIIDALVEEESVEVRHDGDTTILDVDSGPVEYYTQAFNPSTCVVELYRVQAFTRHSAPDKLYLLRTACGRSATLTGDHNLWVLRDGRLQLIETADARPTDCVPVPVVLHGEGSQQEVDTLEVLAGKGLYVNASAAVSAFVSEHGSERVTRILTSSGVSAQNKLYAIAHRVKGQGIKVDTFRTLLNETKDLGGHWDATIGRVGGKAERCSLPARMPLTDSLLRLVGYYIAEGHYVHGSILLANRHPGIREDIESALTSMGIPFSVRPSTDYQVSSTALAYFLGESCGAHSRSKQLPQFWSNLSNQSLAQMLRAYFDGDGTVERANVVSATTASKRLASDLAYALLRFGIWARIARTWKRATNASHAGDWYYKVTISGQPDLRRFKDSIGFSVEYKQEKLEAQLGRNHNSNVDLVPIDGDTLRWLRLKLNLSAEEVGKASRLSRSAVQAIELGKRSPQRHNLAAILDTLREIAIEQDAGEDWWDAWGTLRGLCEMRWTRIASVEPAEYTHPHVYDLSVPGAETFLAGNGGFFVHNTFVMAKLIESTQKTTLVLAHNKTLAAQLYQEFKDFFPNNAVEYFVSYYDYYQPEAYIPRSDLYIEKDADINEEIDKLRHAATRALFERKDVIIVASVSCIFGLGSPEEYGKIVLPLKKGGSMRRNTVLRKLIDMHYKRNDQSLVRGNFRVRGDTLELMPAYEEMGLRVEFWGDEIERILEFDPLTGEVLIERAQTSIYPAKHFITSEEKLAAAIQDIEAEMVERVTELKDEGKLVEAQRLEQRTKYDLEMLQETGYCSGVENYSRHLSRRQAGETPSTLLNYFPDDWLLMVDESHITLPQVRGMFGGDRSRKLTLIEYGFRLPSAADNRPLTFPEFEQHVNQAVYVSATPGPYEYEHSEQQTDLIIRPTGLIDPSIEVKPTDGQIDDLVEQIKMRIDKGQRALVTTMRTKFAEQIADYLKEVGIRAQYIHHEIEVIERVEILRDLRLGIYDVVVGINLLREGLDLPEVSLIAILDADKEGFLRSRDALIQQIGRAARHVEGHVIMYADVVTRSMQGAIEETYRRREIQIAHNLANGIEPASIQKEVRDLTDRVRAVAETQAEYTISPTGEIHLNRDEIARMIKDLEGQMKSAAKLLEFEKAAALRDKIVEFRRMMEVEV